VSYTTRQEPLATSLHEPQRFTCLKILSKLKLLLITCIQNFSGIVVGKNSEKGKSKERSNKSPQNAM
jgi:hypothetical protein